MAVLGVVVILMVVAGAVFAPWIAPLDRDQQNLEGLTLEAAPLPPGGLYLMGTDLLGRDLFNRILYGAPTSLVIGVVASGLALVIGKLVGLIVGYFRSWVGHR